METVLLAFMLIAAVCIGAATYNLMKISSLPARERYKVLRFKGDSLTIGYGLFAHTYKLNEILEVQFVKFPIKGRWSLGGYVGELRVIKMNGHRCRWISFDGSVYYGHIVWITNEHIIDLSTDLLMMGIWYLSTATANKFAGMLSGLYPEAGKVKSIFGYQIATMYE